MWPIPLTLLTSAVRTLTVPNVSSNSRNLALASLCLVRAAFLSACFFPPCRFFRANALRLSLSSRCLLPRVLPSFFRLQHSKHFSTFIVDPFAYSRVPSEHPYSPCFGSSFFRGGDVPTFTLATANDFSLMGCITTSRCCWQACTVSIDEFSINRRYKETSIHTRTL